MIATSWDGSVTMWSGKGPYKWRNTSSKRPLLCCSWNPSEFAPHVAVGGVETGMLIHPEHGSERSFTSEAGQVVSAITWTSGQSLMTGSWSKTLTHWDLRSSNRVQVQAPDRVYALDFCSQRSLLVAAMANRTMAYFDIRNPKDHVFHSPLSFQSRCVRWVNGSYFLLAGIDGSCAAVKIGAPIESSPIFMASATPFKAVNAIDVNTEKAFFATACSDGSCSYWDVNTLQKLRSSRPLSAPLTAIAFNRSGSFASVASGDDFISPTHSSPSIFLSPC